MDQKTPMRLTLAASLLLTLAAAPASASSSAWFSTEGARLRLVTSGPADADGVIHGVLTIDLKPGWKTYWRDPGGSGVPPNVDVSKSANIAAAEIRFPAPLRFNDESGVWVGYKHSVDFPVDFRIASTGPAEIRADIFIGICQTICVPVQAHLVLDPAGEADSPDDAALLAAARQALPGPAGNGFEAQLLRSDPKQLTVAASVPPGSEIGDLFLAGTEDYMFGPPVKNGSSGGRTVFTVPILTAPAAKPAGAGLAYTLVSDKGAVEGLLPFP